MTTIKKELAVAALENGTVIDRIPSEQLFKVVTILRLDTIPNSITIGNNLNSKKIGRKGIIKVADYFFRDEEINKIALIAPEATINVIRNYKVVEKYRVALHDTLRGIAVTPSASATTSPWRPCLMSPRANRLSLPVATATIASRPTK